MPLLDHFRPPLSDWIFWHSFHNSWATYISSQINDRLPAGYHALANVTYGIEIDVAAFERTPGPVVGQEWAAPPQATLPFNPTEAVVEIGIFNRRAGPLLIGAIELVSPANKDRPATRDAFVSKCAAYLQAGVGLVIVDVVTEYTTADLHAELLARLGSPGMTGAPLFGAAYRPVERDRATVLDVWHEPLAVGGDLPTLPLWLRGGLCVPVEFQATYDRTCREQRVTPAA